MSADRIIVAIDSADAAGALRLANSLVGAAKWVKIGMTTFYSAGPGLIAEMREMGFEVFVDLKLHDIPHQVAGAARSLGRLGAGMLTVHASGGRAMVRAAVDGAREGALEAGMEPPKVLAVSVLTSLDEAALAEVGVSRSIAEQVELLAVLSREAGVDGMVCSPLEIGAVRRILGEGGLVVTPGVRPSGSAAGDQSRIATPAEALAAGATHLVIGRPITSAADPRAALEAIAAETA